MDLYFMSAPTPNFELRGRSNFKSRGAVPVDAALARREWLELAQQIESLGGTVVVMPSPSDALTGLPFAAEAGHPLPAQKSGGRPRFILPNMKSPHRQGERDVWRPFVESLGFETLEVPDGIWEGQGDVAKFGELTFLFWGGRTDERGLRGAREFFRGDVLSLRVRDPAFHGNMAVLPLRESVLVCADVLHEDSMALLEASVGRDALHLITEEEMHAYAANGLVIGDTVLAPSILPARVEQLIAREGLNVKRLPMTELCEKAGGASRCLVCVFNDAPSDLAIPEAFRLSTAARAMGG